MTRFLIIYGSKHGQTAKIANVIGKELLHLGHSVEIFNVGQIPGWVRLRDFESIIIGGSVHASGYSRALQKWVRAHAHELSEKRTVFFSVCLGILQGDPKVQKEVQAIPQSFFRKTGWHPSVTAIFPGALVYSKYNWLLKRVMRSIARHAGVDTDIHRDYEYTDWNEVRRFARQVTEVGTS